jgi:hypothetical protein
VNEEIEISLCISSPRSVSLISPLQAAKIEEMQTKHLNEQLNGKKIIPVQ